MQILLQIFENSEQNKWPFPQQFDLYKNAGVTDYHVDVCRCIRTFYGTFGTWVQPAPKDFKILELSQSFSEDGIRQALKRKQQDITTYHAFLAEIAAAGVSHYKMNMKDRTATYCNPDETKCLVEQVPIWNESK